MRLIRDLPIRRKLLLLLGAVVFVVLLLSVGALSVNTVFITRAAMLEEYSALASVVAASSEAALAFEQPADAEQALGPLREAPEVLFACAYDKDGDMFATYQREGAAPVKPPPVRDGLAAFASQGYLEVFQPVMVGEERLGTVYLQVSGDRLQARLRRSWMIGALVLLVCLGVAAVLALAVQRAISGPIVRLVAATQRVREGADYTVRVEEDRGDELGLLTAGFNAMLAQIQTRDAELAVHRLHLEERVASRTRDLGARTEELALAAADLARRNADLNDFAYIASHDLQEPLRKIQAFGNLLTSKHGQVLGAEGQDYVQRMQRAAERMQTLINDLLSLSRITRKGEPFAPVDLRQVARDVLQDLETRITQTGGQVQVGDLPTLQADATQVRQLLQNLIGNALKYRCPDRPPRVTLQAGPVDAETGDGCASGRRMWRIEVRDNGIGFEQKYAEQIFQPFQRLHGRGEYEGTGMGLAICRKIVERHGGTIAARGTAGAGATFIVTLPLTQPQQELTDGPRR